MVEVYGALLLGRRDCQSAASDWLCSTMASMSIARANVTTSASSPSITERACLPEPPCELLIVTVSPVCACQCAANAALNSR